MVEKSCQQNVCEQLMNISGGVPIPVLNIKKLRQEGFKSCSVKHEKSSVEISVRLIMKISIIDSHTEVKCLLEATEE